MIAALSGGPMKQNPCPHVASSWLAPAVQAASLLCSRITLSSAFPFISACSEGSSPSLPLFAVWLCLFLLLSRSPLIRLRVLYSCSLGWAERNWLQSIQQQIELYWLVPYSCRRGALLPFNYHSYPFSASMEWLGVCMGVWGIIWPWGKSLQGCRDYFFFLTSQDHLR